MIWIQFADGNLHDACVLTLSGQVMRAALKGYDDAVEFQLTDGVWLSEDGREAQFRVPMDAIPATPRVPQSPLRSQAMPLQRGWAH